MSATNAAEPDDSESPSKMRAILWNTLIFGILSGALLAVTAYYKIVGGDDSAVIAFGPLVAIAWIVAGFLASKRAISTAVGAFVGLLAAVVGAVIGATVDQALAQAFIIQWVAHVNVGCDLPGSGDISTCVDAATLLAREGQATIVGLITLPVAGLICGFIGGIVGPGSAARSQASDEDIPDLDEDGRPVARAHVPLIKSYRSPRGDGAQRTDNLDVFLH